jgi:hypothetical protein
LHERIVWYANDGGGGFSPPDTITTAFAPDAIFPADIDGDTDVDLVAYNNVFPNQSMVWMANDGDGDFAARTSLRRRSGQHPWPWRLRRRCGR